MTVPYLFANVSGAVPLNELDANFAAVGAYSNVAGTVSNSAQPNITSVGSLNSLTVVGNISGHYILGNGSQLTGLASSSYGNSNVANYLTVLTTNIVTTGDITGAYLIGNGAYITNLYNNSNVAAFLPSYTGNLGNVRNITSVGTISATGNIGGFYILGNGAYLSGMYSNSNVSTYLNTYTGNLSNVNSIVASSNITGGNILTTGIISSTGLATFGNLSVVGTDSDSGNISGGNILTAGVISSTGNATHGNILTSGLISATGNITGNYLLGNGSQLTGLPALYGNANVASYLQVLTSNISTTGNITANYFKGDGSQLTNINVGAATLSTTGNVIGGNILTSGFISAAGNITAGNIHGQLDAATQANITSVGALSTLTVNNTMNAGSVFTLGNMNAGNITANSISVSGNVTGSNLLIGTGSATLGSIINSNSSGVGNIGTSGTPFNTVFAKATSAQYADLAEIYLADNEYSPGTLVVFGGHQEVTVSDISHDTRIAGVVSTAPAYLMNTNNPGLPIALTGRVPCWVQGPVNKGDCLVNIKAGVAGRIDNSLAEFGCIIGKSLVDINSNEKVLVEIAVGRY